MSTIETEGRLQLITLTTDHMYRMTTTICELRATEGLRGVSAFLVCLGHIWTFWVGHNGPWPSYGLEYLSPVTLFFILSGFGLSMGYHPVSSAAREKESIARLTDEALLTDEDSRRDYFRRRVSRLAPMYYTGLLLATPLVLHYGRENDPVLPIDVPVELVLGTPAALAGLSSLCVLVGNRWNSPLWQVSALALYYCAFPVISSRLRNQSTARLWRVLLACQAVSMATGAIQLLALPHQTLLVTHMFAGFRLPHFVMGCAAGLIAKRAPLQRPTLIAEACMLTLMGNLWLCGAVTERSRPSFAAYFSYGVVAEYCLPLVHALLIMSLTSPKCGGPSKALLQTRPLRWLGSISYSLSCTHWPVLGLCGWLSAGGSFDALPTVHEGDVKLTVWRHFTVSHTVPLLCACIAAAAASHYLLEPAARRVVLNAFDNIVWPQRSALKPDPALTSVPSAPAKDTRLDGAVDCDTSRSTDTAAALD